ncbi:hypothetical protein V6R21_28400 [Limibacter armeniacum]|uniref:hypothetical protein n=1 Tax=Limibacter armeniacum TaxID=466084 RepID=UPI002FE50C9A
MRKLIKWGLLFLCCLLLVGLIAEFVFPPFSESVLRTVPKQSMLAAISTNKPRELVQKFQKTPICKEIETLTHFHTTSQALLRIDGAFSTYPFLGWLAKRPVNISLHLTGNNKDLMLVADLHQWSRLRGLFIPAMRKFVRGGLHIQELSTQSSEHDTFVISQNQQKLFGYFYRNLLVISSSEDLLKQSISLGLNQSLASSTDYWQTETLKGDFDLFTQGENIATWGSDFLTIEEKDNLLVAGHEFTTTALSCHIDSKGDITARGKSKLAYTKNSRFTTMLAMSKQKAAISKVVPESVALFSSFGTEGLRYAYTKMIEYDQEYRQQISDLEQKLEIDINEDIFSWVGKEMAFIQTASFELGYKNEQTIAISLNNPTLAQEKLWQISDKTRQLTLQRFEKLNYREYLVGYLPVKDFFRLLFGEFFSKIERPFFSIIDNTLIVSNHPVTIKRIIDDFEAGKTLANQESFRHNISKVDGSTFLLHLQGSTAFDALHGLLAPEYYQAVLSNQELFLSCKSATFGLKKDGQNFSVSGVYQYGKPSHTRLKLDHIAQDQAWQDRNGLSAILDGDTLKGWKAFSEIAPQLADSQNMLQAN